MPLSSSLKVMVLAGGPDRERPVSLVSGQQVAQALRQAGHQVMEQDILPNNLSALDRFAQWQGQVVFPVMHGSWGEGGGLQRILEERRIRYVGCRSRAAELCMDKHAAKQVLVEKGLPTPGSQLLDVQQPGALEPETWRIQPPLAIKPPREGSSIDILIVRNLQQARDGVRELAQRHRYLLAEQFIKGMELTVGVIQTETNSAGVPQALPVIQIVPATEFYDYQAKYDRDDTQYLFDINLPAPVLRKVQQVSVQTFQALGCAHLSRVDVMVDEQQQPWILEVNTIPGFTSHSLLPKAAAKAGIPMTQLVDRLVRAAVA